MFKAMILSLCSYKTLVFLRLGRDVQCAKVEYSFFEEPSLYSANNTQLLFKGSELCCKNVGFEGRMDWNERKFLLWAILCFTSPCLTPQNQRPVL